MKKLIAYLFLALGTLVAPGTAGAEDPVDLVSLREAGLSPATIGRYLAQNLDSTRLAPPIEAGLLSSLGQYGGDELAESYLNLDKQTAHLQRRDFSPEVVERLLQSDMGADKLKNVLDGEAARAAQAAAVQPAVTESDLSPPPSAAPAADVSAAAPPAPAVPPAPARPLSYPTPPAVTAPVAEAPAVPRAAAPAEPQTAAAPPVQAPPAPAAPQPRFQDLRPGQAADPGSKLPPPLDTYEIRRPAASGPWMGVTERELADGHRVEVNTMGDPALVGQEVISRPGGHRVYRYHSGHTDRPAPMTDPEQERKNREDLEIIYGGSN